MSIECHPLPAVAMGGARRGRVLPTEAPEQRDGCAANAVVARVLQGRAAGPP